MMKHRLKRLAGTPCAAGVVRRASRSLTRLYDDHLARAGLTTNQFSILRTLQKNGGRMRLASLSTELVFERTSLYRALAPLRRAGMVTVRSGTDRRAHEIALTARAKRCIDKAMPHWAAAQQVVLEQYGAAAWSTLAAQLGALTAIARSEREGRPGI
jgi:DNA-binding MarR family transcriptional regulator